MDETDIATGGNPDELLQTKLKEVWIVEGGSAFQGEGDNSTIIMQEPETDNTATNPAETVKIGKKTTTISTGKLATHLQ